MEDLSILRKNILEAACLAKEGHVASAFSILEIVFAIYSGFNVVTADEANIAGKNRAKFILSKGHGCLALYAVLAHLNRITWEQFFDFCSFNSICGGHPDRNKHNDIEISSGSLGHGFPIAIGMALAKKIRHPMSEDKVICLIGDGEANEGTLWEGLLFARSRQLTNLILIVDMNLSGERAVPIGDLAKITKSMGLNTVEVDGHNLEALKQTLQSIDGCGPQVVIAHTIKGLGIKEMENNPEWHHKFPTPEQLDFFIEELS